MLVTHCTYSDLLIFCDLIPYLSACWYSNNAPHSEDHEFIFLATFNKLAPPLAFLFPWSLCSSGGQPVYISKAPFKTEYCPHCTNMSTRCS